MFAPHHFDILGRLHLASERSFHVLVGHLQVISFSRLSHHLYSFSLEFRVPASQHLLNQTLLQELHPLDLLVLLLDFALIRLL